MCVCVCRGFFLFKVFLMKKVIVLGVKCRWETFGWTDLTKETLGDLGVWKQPSCVQALLLLGMWMPGQ